MDTTPGDTAAPTPTTSTERHRNAIRLAAHITAESADTAPATLAGSCAGLWTRTMWRAVAAEAGLPEPDSATQSLTVAILTGVPSLARTAGITSITHGAAATCETALRRWDQHLSGSPTPGSDQMRAHVRDALDELEAPAANELAQLRSERPARPSSPEAA